MIYGQLDVLNYTLQGIHGVGFLCLYTVLRTSYGSLVREVDPTFNHFESKESESANDYCSPRGSGHILNRAPCAPNQNSLRWCRPVDVAFGKMPSSQNFVGHIGTSPSVSPTGHCWISLAPSIMEISGMKRLHYPGHHSRGESRTTFDATRNGILSIARSLEAGAKDLPLLYRATSAILRPKEIVDSTRTTPKWRGPRSNRDCPLHPVLRVPSLIHSAPPVAYTMVFGKVQELRICMAIHAAFT